MTNYEPWQEQVGTSIPTNTETAAMTGLPIQMLDADPQEPAPPNTLPSWDECCLIIDNAEFGKRASAGLEGSVLDTPPTTPEPTELHRFIHEYDDADPYRSAWFLHRLERLLNEVRALTAPGAAAHRNLRTKS
jgi:hypothetical protein